MFTILRKTWLISVFQWENEHLKIKKKVSSLFYGGIFFCWRDNNQYIWSFGHIFQFLFRDIVSWEACIKMLGWWKNDKKIIWVNGHQPMSRNSAPVSSQTTWGTDKLLIFQLSISLSTKENRKTTPECQLWAYPTSKTKKKKKVLENCILSSSFQFYLLSVETVGRMWSFFLRQLTP